MIFSDISVSGSARCAELAKVLWKCPELDLRRAPGPWIIGDSQERRKRGAQPPGALSWKVDGRGAAWRDLFQCRAISCRSELVYAPAHSAIGYKPVYFVHDLIPFEAPESFRERSDAAFQTHEQNPSYGAGAVAGPQGVARRLRGRSRRRAPTLVLQGLTSFIAQL
ncbi:Hypothetical protein BN69_1311 [Methylocystis sp. SC2]|nr:Hypothetical protein BN69_1311 [Methylocystis sp. SC2]